jgi:class 3 adenylate cyclase/TolB-like protein/Flp pilus assembly protein TadD
MQEPGLVASPSDDTPSAGWPISGGPGGRRRLVAVVAADVAGYSRLMHVDENDTHRRMKEIDAQIVEPQVAARRGEIVKHTGDGFLATFDNVEDAIACTIEMQRLLGAWNEKEPLSRRINYRMGVNVADVIVEDHDIFGDGVNIAARLQTYAEPGGIVVTDLVARHISGSDGVALHDLGDLPLRNIGRPVRAFSLSRAATSPLLAEVLPGFEERASIVVLPFSEQPKRPGEEYFAEGIVDDIIHALAGLKELFVISRGSTLGFQDTAFDVRAVGRELGVRYVLHGNVRRTEPSIRIRTELYNAESGAIVYTDQHAGEMADLFDLQRRIAARVVTTIAPQVRERERLRALRKHPRNMTAYDFVLQALGPLFHMDYASFSLAHGLLQSAIAHDPHYGPAYSYTAYWHLLRVGQGWSPDIMADAEGAARAASTAIELDENDALALAIHGHVHSYLRKDFDTAIELQDRAIELGPSCAMAWTLSSVTRGLIGQGAAAVVRAERGLELSPRGPHVVYHEHILSQAHYTNANYDEAVAWGRRAAKRNDRLTSNLRCLVAALMATGQEDEARRTAVRLLELDPGMSLATFARRTPLQGEMRDTFIARLRAAGLSD